MTGGYQYLGDDESQPPEPRLLKTKEIDQIVNALPEINAATKKASEVMTSGIRSLLREFLEHVRMVPEKETIQLLIDFINEHHGLSLVVPGDSIGTNGASGLSAIITQLTLNTFHRAGFSETISALNKLESLINAKPVRKDEACIIVFQKRGTTFEEARLMASKYVGSVISDFISDYSIMNYETVDFETNYWLDSNFLESYFTAGTKVTPVNVFRFSLNVINMSKHKVKVEQIAEVLSRNSEKIKTKKGQPFFVAHGSQLDGVIDIIFHATVDNPKLVGNIECVNFEKYILPSLPKLTVKGIPNLKVWTPVKISVMKLVTTEKPLSQMESWYEHLRRAGKKVNKKDKHYFLFLDKMVEVRTGLNHVNLELLFNELGIEVVHYFTEKRVLIVKCEKPPSEIVAKAVTAAQNRYKEDRKTLRRELTITNSKLSREDLQTLLTIQCDIPRPKIVTTSEYVYVVTQNNIAPGKSANAITLYNNVMAMSVVDRRYTYSNNMHVMAEVIGIEASLASQHYELYEIINDSGTYVNSSVIVLIIEFIMSRGKPAGATFVGISRHPSNALATATLERAKSVFTTASIIGEKKPIRENISSTVCMGLPVPVGTGSVVVGKKITLRSGVEEIMIDDEIPTAFYYDKNYVAEKSENTEEDNSQEDINEFNNFFSGDSDVSLPVTGGISSITERTTVNDRSFSISKIIDNLLAYEDKSAIIVPTVFNANSLINIRRSALMKNIKSVKKILTKNNVGLASISMFLERMKVLRTPPVVKKRKSRKSSHK
jgi:hypothetical protein